MLSAVTTTGRVMPERVERVRVVRAVRDMRSSTVGNGGRPAA